MTTCAFWAWNSFRDVFLLLFTGNPKRFISVHWWTGRYGFDISITRIQWAYRLLSHSIIVINSNRLSKFYIYLFFLFCCVHFIDCKYMCFTKMSLLYRQYFDFWNLKFYLACRISILLVTINTMQFNINAKF